MPATLADAIRIAVLQHGQTMDKSDCEPYILHPLRLMLKQQSDHARMVAVLHDVVEDTNMTLEQVDAEGFAPEVIEALRLLTHNDGIPYEDYIERIAVHSIARSVKLVDLEDNMDVRRLKELAPRAHARIDKYLRSWQRLKAAENQDAQEIESTHINCA